MRIHGKLRAAAILAAVFILLGAPGCSMPYEKPAPAPPDRLQPLPPNSGAADESSSEAQNTVTGNGMDQPAPTGSGNLPSVTRQK